MHDHEKGNIPNAPANSNQLQAEPSNAFNAEYLNALAQRDEPLTASEAEARPAHPVEMEAIPGSETVLKVDETVYRTRQGVFRERPLALLAAAVMPAAAHGRIYWSRPAGEEAGVGHEICRYGDVVGHVDLLSDDLLEALNLGDALLRSPDGLAALNEAAGSVALEATGRLMAQAGPKSVGAG